MEKIGRLWLALIFLLFALLSHNIGWASDQVSVTATVDRESMEEGDTFILLVRVISENSVSVEEPRLPNLKNLDLINSWSASETSSTYSNGQFQVQQSRTFNYMLAPNQIGKLKIDPVEVVVNGKSYQTSPIEIEVKQAGSLPKSQTQQTPNLQQRPDSFDDIDSLFSQLLQRRMPQPDSQPINPKDAFFIKVEVDKTKVYEGEQITASWYLYTRGSIREIDTLKYPSLNGFWKEEIDLATRLDFQNEVVNGEVYKRALLVSYALFPIKPGKAIIDPYKAKCAVMVSSGFGFGRQYYFTKASKPLDIEVLPIPAEGRPPDYAGAVGKFSVRAEISEKSVPVNQPITLKVRFDGKGNGKLITLPKLNLPPTVEIYDTKTESKFFKNGQSYKEFEVLLIPREAGELRIPPLTFSLFDPTLGQFYQQVTPELSMIVTPASADQTIASTPLENVQDKEADLETKQAPTLPELALGWDGTWNFPISGWPLWISLYLGTFLLLTGWAVFQFGLWPRGRDVQKLYRERIQKVQRLAEKGEWRLVGVEGINTVYFVLGEVTGVGGGSQELEQLILKAPPSVRREVEGPLRKIMLAFEALGFAPEELVGALKEKSELKRLAKELNDLLSRSLDLAVSSVSDANTSTANMETKT